MKKLCLVTGANGHLGNNIVRSLLSHGYRVRGTVRNLANKKPFEGIVAAAEKGKNQQRYILTSEFPVTTRALVEIAKSVCPGLKFLKLRIPKIFLSTFAKLLEYWAMVTGHPPVLTVEHVELYYGNEFCFDITRARKELNFNPRSPQLALIEAFRYLNSHLQNLDNFFLDF